MLLTFACALAVDAAHAQDDERDLPAQWAERRANAELLVVEAKPADVAVPEVEAPATAPPPPYGAQPNYVLPIYEVIGFNLLLNLYDRHFQGDEYKSTLSSIRRNLHSSWVTDSDPFSINQLYHPYQGATYFGFARSAGIDYWHSLAYSIGGSAMWEVAGETTPPSRNDLINTGIGGSFFGEALFRLANLLLVNDSIPPFWREVGAAAISPSTGFNRLAFGDRFKGVFDAHDPVNYSRLLLGFSGTAQNTSGTSTTQLHRNEALAEYAIDYGLPGKPGYTYDRPYDYFTLQATASSANGFENLMTRGMLLGTTYAYTEAARGIWGLYGSYDYIAPQIFRISSTALSLGTTGQFWASDNIAIQGTGMFGVGYAAAGTLHGAQDPDNRDYHYGVAPQALLGFRMIFGDRYSLDLTGREYFVSKLGGVANTGGHDNIARLDAALTYRISGKHAVSLRYLLSRRDASFGSGGDLTQQRGTIGIYYTLLGHDRFGAVDWRR